ncbi:MAG: putative glycoside hydrolase, partial [Thermodesulfobacteriota bacterium]
SHFYGSFQNIANPGNQPFIVISETCQRFSALLEGKEVTLRPWIQAFPFGTSTFGEDYILEELRALSQSRARGWLFWSAGNAYDVAWKALAQWNNTALEGKTIKAQMSGLDEPFIE